MDYEKLEKNARKCLKVVPAYLQDKFMKEYDNVEYMEFFMIGNDLSHHGIVSFKENEKWFKHKVISDFEIFENWNDYLDSLNESDIKLLLNLLYKPELDQEKFEPNLHY